MTDELWRLGTIVTCCGNVAVAILAKDGAIVSVIAKLITLGIIDKKDAHIITYMTIAADIHIIEESKVAKDTDMELIGVRK